MLSGYILIHQFCRIGSLAMLGARTIVRQDIPPYCMLAENNCICGPNTVGLRRAGFDSVRRMAIRRAIKSYFFRKLNTGNALALIEKEGEIPEEGGAFRPLHPGDRTGHHARRPRSRGDRLSPGGGE